MIPLCADQSMGGGEELDVLGVALDGGGKPGRSEHPIESVADVFKFAIEFIAVAIEPVLEAFQEVGRKVGAITGWIAMGDDHGQAVGEEPAVTLGRTSQPTTFQPDGGPRQRVEQHSAIAVEVARGVTGIKPAPHLLEQLADRVLGLGQFGVSVVC